MQSILALNCGSSSVKFAVFNDRLERTASGLVEGLGGADATSTHQSAIHHILNDRIAREHGNLAAVGHRVVHGGAEFTMPTLITDETLNAIKALTPLAPAHQPHNVAGIEAISAAFPKLPQVACFDTAFHTSMPPHRKLFPLPEPFALRGLRRYGFHGLSYEHIVSELPRHLGERASGKIILCHLGNGCSLAAINNFKCEHTTMGFTPLDGLVMGQRPGRIDAGAVLWLVEQFGNVDDVRKLLNQQSGLLGISGISADMRTLLQSTDPRAERAIQMFVDRLAQEIAAAAAALGGLDAIVFSGGIGENAASVRLRTMDALSFLGLKSDTHANQYNATTITRPDSKISAHVIATNEELTIASATRLALRI
jgi:acetate kinase